MANITRSISLLSKFLGSHCTGNAQLPRMSSTLITKLMYSEFGDPTEVVRKVEDKFESLKPSEVLIKMLASPINPADINTIQGVYPSRPTLPAVAGNEGVGEVVEIGPSVRNVSVGDRVIPLTNNSGTWRTHLTLTENVVFKVPIELGLIEAATLKVNPCTAYRMLSDFVDLKVGDTVIQNGANSACGQYIIQLCHAWNINTVNIIRDRPNIEEVKNFLKELGTAQVLTEEELRKTTLFKDKILPRPRLALNCVGGKSSLEVLRHLDSSGCMVTYGGMSRDPVTIPTSALIFKDVRICGFWMTRWGLNNYETPGQSKMFNDLIQLMTEDRLRGPAYELVDLNDYKDALANAMDMKGMVGKKYVLKYS